MSTEPNNLPDNLIEFRTEDREQANLASESPSAIQAFEDYVEFGRTQKRSLVKLAEYYRNQAEEEERRRKVQGRIGMPPVKPFASLASLERWSTLFNWGERLVERAAQEREESIKDTAKYRAKLSKMRFDLAQTMQASGMTILDKAKLESLDMVSARKMLGDAFRYMSEGMKIERLELGETPESFEPPKNLEDMTQEEFDNYAMKLYDPAKKKKG